MVKCPSCVKEPLVVLELDGIEIDYCLECKGIWLDADEIELLLGGKELLLGGKESAAAVLTIGSPASAPPKEKPRKCPICDRRMGKEVTSDDKPVVFDRCAAGDGLWFDGGELAQVMSQSEGLRDAPAVSSFLMDIFRAKP